MYRIVFYRSSVGREIIADFIDSFDDKTIDKIRTDIRLLKEFGLSLLVSSKVKKIHPRHSLYELRIKSAVQIRLLFIHVKPDIFAVVSSFVKKTRKTPPKEIETAIKRIKEFDI